MTHRVPVSVVNRNFQNLENVILEHKVHLKITWFNIHTSTIYSADVWFLYLDLNPAVIQIRSNSSGQKSCVHDYAIFAVVNLKEIGPIASTFLYFLRFWYQNIAHIFLIIDVKSYG